MDNRKREWPEAGSYNSNDGVKKSKHEMESYSTGLGSKSNICRHFSSMSGCPFNENCHFIHYYVPTGYDVVGRMTNVRPPVAQVSRNMQGSGEGQFAAIGDPGPGPVSSFGDSVTAKVTVDASFARVFTRKGGSYSQQIRRKTGAKLCIQDHEINPNLKNIELEGTLKQINEACAMVKELSGRLRAISAEEAAGSDYKTKLCENFLIGNCTIGDRCQFAHGEADLRSKC